MYKFRSILILLFVLGATIANTQSTFKGEVSFVSDAPMELIKATSKKLNGKIDLVDGRFAFAFLLSTLEGFNSALQKEHFHENYLESSKFPSISYSGKLIDPMPAVDGHYLIRTKGFFEIHGIKKERILKNEVDIKNGNIEIKSSFDILLEDYNIAIPKIVKNKISDKISIKILIKST